MDGFAGVTIDAWLWGAWHSDELGDKTVDRPPGLAVVDRLHRKRSLAAEELTFLRAHTDRIAKVTLPSPTLFGNLWDPERSSSYSSRSRSAWIAPKTGPAIAS